MSPEPTYKIFIVDDERTLAQGMVLNLEDRYLAKGFELASEAISAMEAGDVPDLVLMDVRMPGMGGIEALKIIKSRFPEVLVIMVTAMQETETVIQAMKLGAYDYIVKPILMDLFDEVIKKALETVRLKKEVELLKEKSIRENLPWFVGQSRAISEAMEFIKRVAQSPDTPVLILGESGTGKEMLARAIHFHSPNSEGPFVGINCAAIPSELIESELFGYSRGAFSGADKKGKNGLIEEAGEGTLFLDEIGDMSLDAQAKLLRFLDSGHFYRVGSTEKREVRTRLVCATNKNIESMVKDGGFRQDFYFRISVVKVEVPTLSERRSDIVPMAKQFLLEFAQRFEKSLTSLSREAEKALEEHPWQGNVRELRNVMERAVLVENGPVLEIAELTQAKAVPRKNGEKPLPAFPEDGMDLDAFLEDRERAYISEALRMAKGKGTVAARLLGEKYTTFRYRVEKLFPKPPS